MGQGPEVGPDALLALRLAVRASIFFSSSATRLSAFFGRLRVGAVKMHWRLAFAHRLHGPGASGLARSAGSHRTFNPRQASQALARFGSTVFRPRGSHAADRL